MQGQGFGAVSGYVPSAPLGKLPGSNGEIFILQAEYRADGVEVEQSHPVAVRFAIGLDGRYAQGNAYRIPEVGNYQKCV